MRWLAVIFAVFAAPLAAQEVYPCDDRAWADAIVEPWETHTRTFANGDVRVAVLDAIEPALGSYYFLVLSPPYDDTGRQCQMVGFHGGVGFTNIRFDTLTVEYVPSRGLEMQLLVRIAEPAYDFTNAANLWVTLNQSSGEITTFMELGNE